MGPVYLRSCDSAQMWLDETMGKEVTNVNLVNTEESDFAPTIFNDKLYFCSSGNRSKQALISFDGGNEVKRMDIFQVNLSQLASENAVDKKVKNVDAFNTSMHEGSICFSKSGEEMYFTRTIKGKRDVDQNGITNLLQIFCSKKDSLGNWSEPTSDLSMNNTKYSTFHPALSHDGNSLYFVSDKPGGYGKTDIYCCKRKKDGSWDEPVNLGSSVNTFGYELFPSVYNDSTLYFSSNAHPGMGQLDIFKTTFTSGKWNNVQSLKPPVNSIGNDFGISFDGENNRGFFSSDRFNGKGAEDIYAFSEDVPLHLAIADDTLKFEDKKIFDGIKYTMLNESDSTENELNPAEGKYKLKLDNKKYYMLIAKKNGFTYNKIRIRFVNDTSTNDIHIILNSESKPVMLNGHFSSTFFKKKHDRGEYLIKFSSIESIPATVNVDNNGYFDPAFIEPNNYYFLYSQIIYP
jgi:hypothetical protein